MRRFVFVVVLVVVATSLAAADVNKTQKATAKVASIDVDRPVAKGFPTVAKNQLRPQRIATLEVQDLDVDGPFGGGYTQGGCNCKRNCRNSNTQCKLIDDVAQGCKYTANLVCQDCLACVP